MQVYFRKFGILHPLFFTGAFKMIRNLDFILQRYTVPCNTLNFLSFSSFIPLISFAIIYLAQTSHSSVSLQNFLMFNFGFVWMLGLLKSMQHTDSIFVICWNIEMQKIVLLFVSSERDWKTWVEKSNNFTGAKRTFKVFLSLKLGLAFAMSVRFFQVLEQIFTMLFNDLNPHRRLKALP